MWQVTAAQMQQPHEGAAATHLCRRAAQACWGTHDTPLQSSGAAPAALHLLHTMPTPADCTCCPASAGGAAAYTASRMSLGVTNAALPHARSPQQQQHQGASLEQQARSPSDFSPSPPPLLSAPPHTSCKPAANVHLLPLQQQRQQQQLGAPSRHARSPSCVHSPPPHHARRCVPSCMCEQSSVVQRAATAAALLLRFNKVAYPFLTLCSLSQAHSPRFLPVHVRVPSHHLRSPKGQSMLALALQPTRSVTSHCRLC